MPGKCQMLSRYDKALCSDALAKGSSLRMQTDGSSALPTESNLLAIGTESTATSKKNRSLHQDIQHLSPVPTATSAAQLCCQRFQASTPWLPGCFQASKPWLSRSCTQATSGKKIKMFLNFISRLPGIFSPQRK